MLKYQIRSSLALALLSCFATLLPCETTAGQSEEGSPGKIVAGMPSADEFVNDLKWIVVELGEDEKTWDTVLRDAIEIFMIGVDTERPVGLDVHFDEEGHRVQLQIPIADIEEFIEDNLAPIDINASKRGKDFWHLDSPTLDWKGFMRKVDNFASISTEKDDVPKDMPSPQDALDKLLSPGYDLAAQLQNTMDGISGRREAMAKIRTEAMEGVKKKTDETREEFDLRKALAEHQLDRFERLFSESETVTFGWTTDAKKGEARGVLALAGLPGTDLAKVLQQYGTQASYFSAIQSPANGVVRGRINLPVDEHMQAQADEFYKLVEPVWKQQVDQKEGLTDAQRTARKQIMDLVLEMLDDGRNVGAIDGFLEMQPTAEGTHTFLFGIRTGDGTKAAKILELAPQAVEGWKVDLNIEESGGVAIHRLESTGEMPKAMTSFYGDSGEVFIGTHKDALWISGGANALARLKETIQVVQNGEATVSNEVFVLDVRLGPILTHLDDLATEVDFTLEKWMGKRTAQKQTDEDADEKRESRRPAEALKGVDIKSIALPILQKSSEDRIRFLVIQEEGEVKGTGTIEKGVLSAVGKIIATVAKDKLGS